MGDDLTSALTFFLGAFGGVAAVAVPRAGGTSAARFVRRTDTDPIIRSRGDGRGLRRLDDMLDSLRRAGRG